MQGGFLVQGADGARQGFGVQGKVLLRHESSESVGDRHGLLSWEREHGFKDDLAGQGFGAQGVEVLHGPDRKFEIFDNVALRRLSSEF